MYAKKMLGNEGRNTRKKVASFSLCVTIKNKMHITGKEDIYEDRFV